MEVNLQFPASSSMIAAHLGRPIHQIQKIANNLRIEPARRFGIVKAFDQAGYEKIVAEVERIDALHTRRRLESGARRANNHELATAAH